MSDFSGIAGVTRTLVRLLDDRMREIATVTVTAAPPGSTPQGVAGSRLNVFLYRVQQDPTLRNQDLPAAAPPLAFGRPPLSLDLCYLVHAEGADPADDAAAHRVLGDAMLVLHEVPIVTASLLRSPR